MSGEEFLTNHMWTNALDIATYATGSAYETTGVIRPWRDAYALQSMMKVQTVTGAVVMTPTIQRSIDGVSFTAWEVLAGFTPIANTYYFMKFDWEKMDLGGSEYISMRISFALAGGTSILMGVTWLHEQLKRTPRANFHYEGLDALGDDSNGNPKIIRIDQVI
jgi:hypothetical protein